MERLLTLLIFALASAFLIRLIRPQTPHFALVASLCAGVLIVLAVIDDLTLLLESVQTWAQAAQVRPQWIASLLKILAICLAGQWGSRFCRDAGEDFLAEKLETAVKVSVLLLCVPYLDQLFSLAVKFS